MQSWQASELTERVRASGAPWLEFLKVPDLSAGVYQIPAGGEDPQQPHTEDEVYLVLSGRGALESGGRRCTVAPGSVLFVPAHEVHRFVDVEQDLALLVVFGPAEYSRGTAADPQPGA